MLEEAGLRAARRPASTSRASASSEETAPPAPAMSFSVTFSLTCTLPGWARASTSSSAADFRSAAWIWMAR